MRYLNFYALLVIFGMLGACSNNPLDVPVAGDEAEVRILRLDSAFFLADFSKPDSTNQVLYQSFGGFYKLYLEDILRTGEVEFSQSLATASEFVSDPYMADAFLAIQEVHNPKMDEYQKELNSAFSHYRYYYPDSVIPDVIFYHSGFNFGIYSMDNSIGVGAEWFLGKDHPITQSLPFPQYRKNKMLPEYLSVNVVKDWCNKTLYEDKEGENLLENIIYYGKIMYLLDALMPHVPDSTKMNWTSAQIEWCEENEFRIWTELAANQQSLFESKPFDVKKWITDGPFTSGLPQESPGMTGVWVGWMMLRDHHRRNPETPLPELLSEEAETILRSYKPKR